MNGGSESQLDVLYVLQDFPIRSERFIEREIRGLLRLGAKVRIVALLRDGVSGPTELDNLQVWRPPRWNSSRYWRFWFRALIAVVTGPRVATEVARRVLGLEEKAAGFPLFNAIRWLPVVAYAADALANDPPSIIHAHFASTPATVALFLSRWLERPFGFSVHAHDFYAETAQLPKKVEVATHVFACSKTLTEDIQNQLPERLHDRVHTVFHGLDLDFWRAPAAATSETVPVVIGVGRFEAKKGFALLLEACSILHETGYLIRCDLVGSGSERDRLVEVIEARGMGELVKLIDWCSPTELRGHYQRASVLAVPSVVASNGDRDNIPNVVVEAFACQLPVVAAALPALQEALHHGTAGLLFQPGNATSLADTLRRACDDSELRGQLRKSGLAHVHERWDARLTSRRIADLLAQQIQ